MKQKRIALVVFFLMIALLSSIVVGCGSGKKEAGNNNQNQQEGFQPKKDKGFVIGFANGYFGNTWRAQFIDQAQKVADKYKKQGIVSEFIVQNVNDDVTQQIQQLNSLIDKGVDALIINPVSPEALAPIVKRAKQKGILIVNVDDPAAYEGTYSVVGDHRSFFGIQVKWLAETLKGKGKIVYISGLAGNSCDKIRTDEAQKILKNYPGIEILGTAPGGWNETKSQEIMTNFLSTYPQIDGVLEQDVMAEGTMRAYEIAGKKMPPFTGDYTFGFLRKWAQHPELQSIGVTYNPGIGADAVEVTVKLLQGYKFKDDVLEPNPLDPNLKNTITVPPAYVVTKEAQPDAPWMQGTSKLTKAISLEEALKLGEGQPDTADLDSVLTEEQVMTFFQPKQ
ncbi:ABC transporter substrate-binding protein [Moorella sp. Hama-1]|uniref:ABC transporter substrate-binding protein n=1 Tax=Moorella sp. Hama-1 TaxID=2138101 RepID=UPI0019144BB1|nr:ABC transporter substrate-binding protein [Moorella sp. Hama-1]BCV21392.1 sugar ABC transporter substrate-binding protein [Moorella sp. Hama-1]